jgi:hypothetical protein
VTSRAWSMAEGLDHLWVTLRWVRASARATESGPVLEASKTAISEIANVASTSGATSGLTTTANPRAMHTALNQRNISRVYRWVRATGSRQRG